MEHLNKLMRTASQVGALAGGTAVVKGTATVGAGK